MAPQARSAPRSPALVPGTGRRRAPLVERIVGNGLCTGCGVCVGMAPPGELELTLTSAGVERPRALRPQSPEAEARLAAICPGIRVEAPAARAVRAVAARDQLECERRPGDGAPADHPVHDRVWGPVQRIAKGYAGDPQVRFRAASGGGLTALASFLLETGEVDFVLHVAASQRDPLRSERRLSFDAAQVLDAAGSRYGPAAPLADFGAVLARGRPFAVVGKPCDIAAVRNVARVDPRVDELVRALLTLSCGGMPTVHRSCAFVEESGVALEELRGLRYRGNGNPGPIAMTTADGRVVERRYGEFWGEDPATWQLQFRCKVCPDAIGEQADVTVFDTWPGGSPTGEDAGFCGFLARTPRGAVLLAAAERAGAIELPEPLGPRELDELQPHQVRKRAGLAPRLVALRLATGLPLRFRGHRLRRSAMAAGPASCWRNLRGAVQRLRAGRHREPLS